MEKIIAWLRQPSSVAGISAAIGALSGVAVGHMNWSQALPVLCGALAAILLPDNSAARGDAQALGTEIMLAMEKRTGAGS